MSATRYTLALMVGLSVAGTATAAEARGVIARLDLEKNELLLDGRGALRGEAMTFVVGKETQVLFGREAGELADLSVGKRVRVTYEMRGDKPVALVIRAFGARPSRPEPKADADAVTGVLQRVAPTDREIVVIGPGRRGPETETTITVPEKVRIVRGDKAVSFEALKEGEQVAVRAEKRDGKLTAVSIQVGAAAAAPEESKTIPRIRRALQLVDQILQMAEQRREKK